MSAGGAAAPDWLNTRPQSLIELVCPAEARLERREFDPAWSSGCRPL
jgi:hypothetical protein